MPALNYPRQTARAFQVFTKTPEGYAPLPDWVYYYLKLGSYVSRSDATTPRLVISVAVPSRAYAAAFCATGIVSARSLIPVDRFASEQYLEWLCSLPVGTEIGYAEGNATVPAVVRGCERRRGVLYLRLQVHGKNGTYVNKLPAAATHRIRDLSCAIGSTKDVVATLDQRGRFISGWCQHLLAGRHRSEFVLRSGVHCIVVGRLTRLREEIADTPFFVLGPDGEIVTDTLHHLLGVEGFGGRHDPYRVKVATSASSSGIATSDGEQYPVVVFDGPAGYLKWRDGWHNCNWIVLLDRSDPSFEPAVEQLNRDFVQRRLGDTTFKGLPVPPPGAEVLAFQEERL